MYSDKYKDTETTIINELRVDAVDWKETQMSQEDVNNHRRTHGPLLTAADESMK